MQKNFSEKIFEAENFGSKKFLEALGLCLGLLGVDIIICHVVKYCS